MSAPRVLVSAIAAAGETIALADHEARHVRSRRLTDGDAVVLLDGRGGRAHGTVADSGRAVVAGEPTAPAGEPARRVVVLLAAAEPARVEWAVEKGTECGAAAFVLLVCERSQASHLHALGSRIARLTRIAAEAVKQCDRTRVPEIHAPRPISDVLHSIDLPLLIARPGAGEPPPSLPEAIAVAIGPEGGFTEGEEALFSARGATAFGLGSRTLRMETATVAALSLLVERS